MAEQANRRKFETSGMDIMKPSVLLRAAFVLLATSVAASAQAPKRIGEHGDWGVYSFSSNNGKVCYVVSQPTRKKPADRDHGDVFFFISTRPKDKVNEEPSVIVGYSFKADSKVTVLVDSKKFTMFTQGEGAWIENATEEGELVKAMRAGNSMTVAGTSTRGTNTSYTYSLKGVTAALKQNADACQ